MLCYVMVRLTRRANERARRTSDVSVTPLRRKTNQVKEKVSYPFGRPPRLRIINKVCFHFEKVK